MVGSGTIASDLQRFIAKIRGKEDPTLKIGVENKLDTTDGEYVWALRDINFSVEQGDVLGIIGKNGAGKSTLLKILSKVTTPTTGNIKIRGRIASLLEVGTGFHPELSGRENIFLNGAILGMTKFEIRSKFDEIVDFAGVGKYIDTPVKRYSSGMYVRLAFAVAAHLEPEILIIDEVLAVGDAEFQKKAMGKMKDISTGQGRTVLFVSHNMAAVKSLCKKGILLANGVMVYQDAVNEVVTKYLKGDNDISNYRKWEKPIIKSNDFELLEIGIKAKGKDFCDEMQIDEELEFIATFLQKNENISLDITLHIKDDSGNKLFSTGSGSFNESSFNTSGVIQTRMSIPANFFNWGSFFVDLFVVENNQKAVIVENDIISFTLNNITLPIGAWMGKEPGSIKPHFTWGKSVL